MDGIPKFVADGNLTPDFYAVNTMQPPYQPSANKPAEGGDPALADPTAPTTLPPQTEITIGDLLSAKGISWAWYCGRLAGGARPRQRRRRCRTSSTTTSPSTTSPASRPAPRPAPEHLRDGGLDGAELIKAIDAGTLPQVTFYKPQGNLNEHAGYADVASGDAHLADADRPSAEEPAMAAHAGGRDL